MGGHASGRDSSHVEFGRHQRSRLDYSSMQCDSWERLAGGYGMDRWCSWKMIREVHRPVETLREIRSVHLQLLEAHAPRGAYLAVSAAQCAFACGRAASACL